MQASKLMIQLYSRLQHLFVCPSTLFLAAIIWTFQFHCFDNNVSKSIISPCNRKVSFCSLLIIQNNVQSRGSLSPHDVSVSLALNSPASGPASEVRGPAVSEAHFLMFLKHD